MYFTTEETSLVKCQSLVYAEITNKTVSGMLTFSNRGIKKYPSHFAQISKNSVPCYCISILFLVRDVIFKQINKYARTDTHQKPQELKADSFQHWLFQFIILFQNSFPISQFVQSNSVEQILDSMIPCLFKVKHLKYYHKNSNTTTFIKHLDLK